MSEHPPQSILLGQQKMAQVTNALIGSSAWTSSALFFTYDEGGGFFEHVAPSQVDAYGQWRCHRACRSSSRCALTAGRFLRGFRFYSRSQLLSHATPGVANACRYCRVYVIWRSKAWRGQAPPLHFRDIVYIKGDVSQGLPSPDMLMSYLSIRAILVPIAAQMFPNTSIRMILWI